MPWATSAGSEVLRGKMTPASSSDSKYGILSGPIRAEATMAGATEQTRIPLGPKKSAAAEVIPNTAATQCQRYGPFAVRQDVLFETP